MSNTPNNSIRQLTACLLVSYLIFLTTACLELNLDPVAGPTDCQQDCFIIEGEVIQAISQNFLSNTEVMLMRERRGDFNAIDRQAIAKINTDNNGHFQFKIDPELFNNFDQPILVANHKDYILERSTFSKVFEPSDPNILDMPIQAELFMRPYGYLNLNFRRTSFQEIRISAMNLDCSENFQDVGFDFTSDTTVALVIPAQKEVCIGVEYFRDNNFFLIEEKYFHDAYEVIDKTIEL